MKRYYVEVSVKDGHLIVAHKPEGGEDAMHRDTIVSYPLDDILVFRVSPQGSIYRYSEQKPEIGAQYEPATR